LGTATLALIYGEPGSGKTFLATDLAMHIALGRSWFGRSVTPGAVVYVACEGAAGISNRLAAFRRQLTLSNDVPIAVIPAAVNLGPGGHDANRIIEAVASVESRTGQVVQLVVLDTLARAMGTGDENSTQDMGLFITACDRIRIATGCTVVIVHHRGKAQIRSECLDHIVVMGEASLRRALRAHTRYYNEVRTHRSLDKDTPDARPIQITGTVRSRPVLGGLHHHYVRI
jgi:RecA-family ATPase